MAWSKSRTQPCDRSDALRRLAQAEAFLLAAEAGRMVGWANRLLGLARRAVKA